MAQDSSAMERELAGKDEIIRKQAELIDQQSTTNEQQSQTIQQQQEHIEKLKRDVDLLRRYIFGRRRERFVQNPSNQPMLFDLGEAPAPEAAEDPDDDEEDDSASKKRRKGHGRRKLPDHLPRKEIHHILEGDELLCPCCNKPRGEIGEEVSEQLEFVPASLFVNRHIRHIYACLDEACLESNVVTAPKPAQPIEKGLPGPGLLAYVVASKLADHLPLNRQEDILARTGVHLRRSTLCGWMAHCAQLASLLYELMRRRVFRSSVLGVDDTPVRVQDADLDHMRKAYFWPYYGDDAHPYVWIDFGTSHARAGPEAVLRGFEGILQGDGYWEDITRTVDSLADFAGCMAHARRYFDRARDSAPTRDVHEALAYIQRLYDVEDEARDMTPEARLALRQEKSVPILDHFKEWLQAKHHSVLPSSALGEAITYALNQWESLKVFTRDGRVEIDNNRVERAVRYLVLGRCNWLFLGSDNGGHTAAVLYSLVITCKRLRIDPWAYLNDVFTRMPSASALELRHLLPDRWIKAHPEHRLVHREKESRSAARRQRARRAKRRRERAAAMTK
jgi:transposase